MPKISEDDFQSELEVSDWTKYGQFSWLVRPCEWYLQEYRDCKCKFLVAKLMKFQIEFSFFTAIRARVHQYFIHGHVIDCDQWRDDYFDCAQFRKTKDVNVLVGETLKFSTILLPWQPLSSLLFYLIQIFTLKGSRKNGKQRSNFVCFLPCSVVSLQVNWKGSEIAWNHRRPTMFGNIVVSHPPIGMSPCRHALKEDRKWNKILISSS